MRFGCFAFGVVGIIGALVWFSAQKRALSRSEGVRFAPATSEGGSAIVDPGGRLVLTQEAPGNRNLGLTLWIVSREGDQVVLECDGCPDRRQPLCGTGCAIRPDFAYEKDLTVWATPRHSIRDRGGE